MSLVKFQQFLLQGTSAALTETDQQTRLRQRCLSYRSTIMLSPVEASAVLIRQK